MFISTRIKSNDQNCGRVNCLSLSGVVGRRKARAYMSVIFTNFHTVSNKLCLLYEQPQEFKSQRITTWMQMRKNKNTVCNDVTADNLKGMPTTKTTT